MNDREVLRKAAEFLEENPHLYDFYKTKVPKCGSPGCLVGIIGMLNGYPEGSGIEFVSITRNILDEQELYGRMEEAIDNLGHQHHDWVHNPQIAAQCLRLLATQERKEQ